MSLTRLKQLTPILILSLASAAPALSAERTADEEASELMQQISEELDRGETREINTDPASPPPAAAEKKYSMAWKNRYYQNKYHRWVPMEFLVPFANFGSAGQGATHEAMKQNGAWGFGAGFQVLDANSQQSNSRIMAILKGVGLWSDISSGSRAGLFPKTLSVTEIGETVDCNRTSTGVSCSSGSRYSVNSGTADGKPASYQSYSYAFRVWVPLVVAERFIMTAGAGPRVRHFNTGSETYKLQGNNRVTLNYAVDGAIEVFNGGFLGARWEQGMKMTQDRTAAVFFRIDFGRVSAAQ